MRQWDVAERRSPRTHGVRVVATWTVGLVLLALGIATAIAAGVGVGPLDVLTTAVARSTPLAIGVAILALNAAMAAAAWAITRTIRAATVATALALGPLVDLGVVVLDDAGLFERSGPWPWIGLAVGIVCIGAGGAVQIVSGWGPSPLDALVVAIVDATDWSLRWVRTALELSFVAVGGLAGGALGAGTLLVAVGVGPVVAATLDRLHPLRRRLDARGPSEGQPRGGG